jgi:hypothetical protein
MSLEDEKTPLAENYREKEIPSLLNLLTILTLVGCCFGLIRSGWVFGHARQNYENALRFHIPVESFYPFSDRSVGASVIETARRSYKYRIPILVFALSGILLCGYGALLMRNLRRRGFTIWVVGELMPVLSTFIFIEGRSLSAVSFFLALLVPAIFFFLYAGQRRYMTE